MKLKSCNIGVGIPQAMGPRRKVAREKVKVSQDTLRHYEWEIEYEEREYVDIREAFGLV